MATLTQSILPISGYTNQYYTYQCVVTENSYTVSNNTSNVTITFSMKGPWAPSYYDWTTYYGIVVDGSPVKNGSSRPYVSTSYIQLATWTGNVQHASDGSKKINVGVYLYNDNTANYLPTQYTPSAPLTMGQVTLTTIPRATTIDSVSNVTLGNACNVVWTPADSSFKYKLKFSLGSWSYTSTTYIEPNTTSKYTYTGYTIPNTLALLDDIPNSTTGTMTATLYTYNSSGTQIGSVSSKTFTVTVPTTVKPTGGTLTLMPETINGQSILVQGKNKLTVSTSGWSAGTGSAMDKYMFVGTGISYSGSSTSVTTTNTIANAGTLTYRVTAIDKRGRTNTLSEQIQCYAWSAPSITLDAYRVESSTSTTKSDNGTYVRCSYNLSYSSVNSTNDVTVKIYYKKNSASSWSSATAISDTTNTSGTYVLSNIAIDSTYTVYATIEDNYEGNTKSSNVTVFSAERIMNVRPNGNGIAVGKLAGTDNVFDSKWPIRSDDPAGTMNNLSFRGNQLIAGTTNDTTANWSKQGNLATTYYNTEGQITDQPSQYGFLLNLTNGNNVHHIWTTQAGGNVLHRGGNSNGWSGTWRVFLDSYNYKTYVSPKPVVFYTNTSYTGGGTITITLESDDALNQYTYLEIFYVDNNVSGHNSVRIYNPGSSVSVDLSMIEVSDTMASRTYIRRTTYNIAGSGNTVTVTPSVTTAGMVSIDGTNISSTETGTNYLRIRRIIGYK